MAKKKRREEYVPERDEPTAEVKEALEIAQGIDDLVEYIIENQRISASGEKFLEDISDKAKSIAGTIENTNRVSDNQLNALKNMMEGVRKWDHSDR